jgi:spore germination cell wall hydrolase CwlJ-like protein
MTRDDIRASLTDQVALTCTIFGEARGEPLLGQIAVGAVIRNRVLASKGLTYVQVCTQPQQFSCWTQGGPNTDLVYAVAEARLLSSPPPVSESDLRQLRQVAWVATGTIAGDLVDPTNGAKFYLTKTTFDNDPPPWVFQMIVATSIGRQVFLKNRVRV